MTSKYKPVTLYPPDDVREWLEAQPGSMSATVVGLIREKMGQNVLSLESLDRRLRRLEDEHRQQRN